MKFTIAMAMIPLDQLVPLARTAEECAFSAVALPDSVFFSERAAAETPIRPTGGGCGTRRLRSTTR